MKKAKRKDCLNIKEALDLIEKLAKKTPKRVGYLRNEHNEDYSHVQWYVTWNEPERDKSEPQEKEESKGNTEAGI